MAPSEAVNEATESVPDRSEVVRIRLFSMVAFVLFALFFALRGEWRSLAGLTCSAAVIMINFLWLEEIALRVLGPAPQVNPWRLGFRALLRYTLVGVATAVFVVRFNILSVLMGMSVLVIGVIGEAVYSLIAASGNRSR